MSGRNGPKLELTLNLSPPRVNISPRVESPPTAISPQSSCASSEMQEVESGSTTGPDAEAAGERITSMLLVGCTRCLMYVMLSENDPKCPKCKSTVLLEFLQDTTVYRH